jgi:DNA ligase-4
VYHLSRQEGLVLKDPKSKYVLNSRLYSWIKIKPEFMDALKENCDVAIIGN